MRASVARPAPVMPINIETPPMGEQMGMWDVYVHSGVGDELHMFAHGVGGDAQAPLLSMCMMHASNDVFMLMQGALIMCWMSPACAIGWSQGAYLVCKS